VRLITKAVGFGVFGIQLANVVLWAINPITPVALVASVLGLLGVIAVVALIALEHRRSVRSSSVGLLYLLAAIVSDAVQLRTLLLRRYVPSISAVASTSIVCKTALLLLESLSKRSYLKPSEAVYSPEETSNVFERSVLWWLNSLFLTGNSRTLTQEDLCPLDRELYSSTVSRRMHKSWKKCMSPSYKMPLTPLQTSTKENTATCGRHSTASGGKCSRR
jgi:ATP-binding cassette, subfamily C (CFTR/MRP), member 1